MYTLYIYIYIYTLITKKVQKKDENRKNGSVSKVKPLNLKGCLVLLFIDAHVGVMVPQCLSYFFSEHLISCQTLNNANYTVYIQYCIHHLFIIACTYSLPHWLLSVQKGHGLSRFTCWWSKLCSRSNFSEIIFVNLNFSYIGQNIGFYSCFLSFSLSDFSNRCVT